MNTVGEYALGKLVVVEAAKAGGNPKAFISQFYGNFYSVVNFLGLILQALGASRVIRYCEYEARCSSCPCWPCSVTRCWL